jgi:hypothetical protein
MGTGMPYYREKGMTWEGFDSFFSHSDPNIRARHKLATLEHLWTEAPVGEFTAMAEAGSPATPYVQDQASAPGPVWQPFFETLVYHCNVDWIGLGIPTDPNGIPVTAQNPGPAAEYYPPTTPKPQFGSGPGQVLSNGWWKNWYGEDTEDIIRIAYIRAIEVSLGLSHPDAASVTAARNAAAGGGEIITGLYELPGEGVHMWKATLVDSNDPHSHLDHFFPRNWPIEFWWTCGLSFFQAWVSWAQGATNPPGPPSENDGRVVVTWLTPPSPYHTTYRDLSEEPRAQEEPVVNGVATTYTADRFGSWLIAQTKNDIVNSVSYYPTGIGFWPLPVTTNYSYDGVVAINPDFDEGGIAQPVDLQPGFEEF